ncbi:hypothetical protein ACIBKY_01090 [Nonomuraea sp. NPDC050394]|uniref:hypothetical protein n=1 Tax=Nonomuraea sp. NPDC050394 TaxID=3364363 RepID=UPI003793FDED
MSVSPTSAGPGERVTVHVHECGATDQVVASSMAFAGRHVRLARGGSPGGWVGSVEVQVGAVSSVHEVTARCSDRLVRTYLTVRGHPRRGPDTGGGGLALGGGSGLADSGLADSEVAGSEVAGSEVAGSELAASEVAASEVAGSELAGDEGRAPWLAGALGVLVLVAGGGALAAWRRWRGSRDAAP